MNLPPAGVSGAPESYWLGTVSFAATVVPLVTNE